MNSYQLFLYPNTWIVLSLSANATAHTYSIPEILRPPLLHLPARRELIGLLSIFAVDLMEGFLVGLQSAGITPTAPSEMLERLIEVGLITRFHADKLAAGKYKGFQLGSYLILDQIGTGGMGQVYLAEHARMRRLVALKVLP